MAKKKYYAVKKGKTPGIYLTWEDCKSQVEGYGGAVYQGFAELGEAAAFLEDEREIPAAGEGEAVAYVDGSYNAETREYGCGVVFFCENDVKYIGRKGEDQEMASMRNVAGEILGASLAMREAVSRGVGKLTIVYDYQGIASWCLGEWKTNKEGTRAYKAYYDSLADTLEVVFRKVKGHSGDVWNEKADELAKQAVF